MYGNDIRQFRRDQPDSLASIANFVFARLRAHAGAALTAALRQRAVIVRHFSAPRIADYLRITVGTDG